MKSYQSGIGLVEILIGLTLFSITGVAIISLLTTANSVFVDQTIQVNQGLSQNSAGVVISEFIRSSSGIATQYPVSGAPQYTTGENVLVLKLPALAQNGSVIDSVFDYAVILKEPDSKILKARVFPDAASSRSPENQVLSTQLKSIKFNYLDSNNVPITPIQAVRINYIINLSEAASLSEQESSSSAVVNLKNF